MRLPRLHIPVWLVTLASSMLWARVVVGEPAQTDALDRSLEDLTGNEVSTVSKIPQRSSEALASVTVIGAEDIQKFGYRTLGEILQSLSGMYLSDDRTYGLLGVRGLNVPGDFNGRTLVLIDGHRVNDPNYDYVPMLEDFPVDVQSIDRIEVIKGTSASVWGGNGIFATVNVITKPGRSVAGKRVVAEYGTFSRRKLFAEVGGITDSEVEYAVSAATVHSNGQRSVYIPAFDGKDGADGVFHGKDGMAAQRVTGRLSYRKVNVLLNTSSRTKSIPGASFGTVFDTQDTTTDDILNLEINTLRPLSTHHSILLRTYHDRQSYHQEAHYPRDEGPRHNWDSSNTGIIGSEFRLIGDWPERGRYIMGVEAQNAYRLNVANADLDPVQQTYKKDGRYRLRSAYLEGMVVVRPGLQLTLGGRTDDYSLFQREWNPRGGVIYALSPKVTLKALYGHAFRIPNNYERNIPPRPPNTANRMLSPEHAGGAEGVMLFQPDRDQSVQLSIFSYRVNGIVTQSLAEDIYGEFINSGHIATKGVDFSWRGHRDSGLSWYVGGSYTDATGNKGVHLENSPHWLSANGISIPLSPRSSWYVSPSVRVISPLKTQAGSSIPWREIVDVSLGSAGIAGGWSGSLSVYNLFGANNPTVVGNQFSFPTMPSEGRTVRLQLGYVF